MTTQKDSQTSTKTFDRSFWISIIGFAIVILIICAFPYLFTRHWEWMGIYFNDSGEIGDTIGGTMGPFIAIAASLLTFFAFWVQYKANVQQREQFQIQILEQRQQFESQVKFQREQFELQVKVEREQLERQLAEQRSASEAQEKTWRIQQFENKYYELIRLHRANVEEINIAGKVSGRKAFVSMFYEFQCCYLSLERIYEDYYTKHYLDILP